jgi:putative addiction module killer protein
MIDRPDFAATPYEVFRTSDFERWIASIRDRPTRARILTRVDRLSLGLFGDTKPVGGAVREMRLDFGPGYRIYFTHRGGRVILLICGGDKSTQKNDIARARKIAAAWEPENGD